MHKLKLSKLSTAGANRPYQPHMFIHKWNEPHLPLLPSSIASLPSTGTYFPSHEFRKLSLTCLGDRLWHQQQGGMPVQRWSPIPVHWGRFFIASDRSDWSSPACLSFFYSSERFVPRFLMTDWSRRSARIFVGVFSWTAWELLCWCI